MIEKPIPLKIPPGLWKNGTLEQSEGRWYDANGVRFLAGTIGPIGGWRVALAAGGGSLAALTGVPRGIVAWRADNGVVRVGIGTHQKLYAIVLGTAHDITPADFVPGEVDATNGSPYGGGVYGAGLYGQGSVADTVLPASTWQLDTFGDYLVGVFTADGRVLVWDGVTTNDAAEAAGAPTDNLGVVVTPEHFLVALGADGVGRRVQWASQGTTDEWTPEGNNSAGDYDLTTNGVLLAGRRTKVQTLLWTNTDLHSMNYIGGDAVYAFRQEGEKCGLIAPNAVAVQDSQAIWMGHQNFFIYDGFVQPVPCDVWDAVFNNFNRTQASKVYCTTNSAFGEVTWFYPCGSSAEVDRYVTYNYREKHWTTGHLARSAACDRGAVPNPIWCAPDGTVYEHEVLQARSGITPHLESGPIKLGNGERRMNIQRIVPDDRTTGDVRAVLYTRDQPDDAETANGPYSLASLTDVRLNARRVRLRLEEVQPVDWRVGYVQLGMVPGSRR